MFLLPCEGETAVMRRMMCLTLLMSSILFLGGCRTIDISRNAQTAYFDGNKYRATWTKVGPDDRGFFEDAFWQSFYGGASVPGMLQTSEPTDDIDY